MTDNDAPIDPLLHDMQSELAPEEAEDDGAAGDATSASEAPPQSADTTDAAEGPDRSGGPGPSN